MAKSNQLTAEQTSKLMSVLQQRFKKNRSLHPSISWEKVEAAISSHPEKLWSIHEMEKTGGEPDVVQLIPNSREIVFVDCSEETPSGRRSLCYDQEALDSRKEAKPIGSVYGMATDMGIELLDETTYRQLQNLGEFDLKTSSWIKSPENIRKLGGALFGDRRYNHVFVYHNGAQSYYAARGFRGLLKI